jgi:hypothetical protein
MATTSKKGLGVSNISNMLDRDPFVEKLPGSDDSQLSGHSQISDTDLHDNEDDALLLDAADDNMADNNARC